MNPIFLRMLASAAQSNTKARDQYTKYLEMKWGKLAANSSDHKKPDFKNDYQRLQFMMAAENMDNFYRNGEAVDAAETTTSTAVATVGMPKVLPGMLRKIMPELFIKNLVNIQSIPLPEAKVLFYKTYKVSSDGTALEQGDKTTKSWYATSPGEGVEVTKRTTFGLSSKSVSAESLKLVSEWTKELETDAMGYFAIDVPAAMLRIKSLEIGLETDDMVLAHMLASATGGYVEWSKTYPAGDTTTEQKKAYDKTLYDAIKKCSNQILSKCYVDANWIVGGVDIIERLEVLENFKIDTNGATGDIARQYVGVLASKYKVYKDPFFMPADTMLMGFKHNYDELYAGYVWAPYIPLYLTATVESPTKFTFSRGIMSRNAKTMLKGDMFGIVKVVA